MRWLAITALVIAWLFPALPVFAQEQAVRTIPFEGPEVFCHILHHLGIKPIPTIKPEELEADADQTLIIVFGKPLVIKLATGGLAHFVGKGGNLLIATDYAMQIPELPVRVTGRQRGSKSSAYRGSFQCPWLPYPVPDSRGAGLNRDHPVFRFLQKGIATNNPSQLVITDEMSSVEPLLEFPRFMRAPERPRDRYMAGSPRDAPAQGRMLFIAGHGMFTNGMMLQSDNDNFAFAVNAVQWLREAPDGGRRPRALFIVDGKVITDFNMSLTPPPLPKPTPTVSMINRLLRGLEDERFFHRVLADMLGDKQRFVVALILGVVTLALLLYGARKILAGRYLPDTHVPLAVGPEALTGASDSLMQRRLEASLRQSNFWPEARALAHEWLRAEFAIPAEQDVSVHRGELQVQGYWWSNRLLRRHVEFVMRLAHGDREFKVSQHDLLQLVKTLQQLSQAIKENHVALLDGG